MMAGKVITFYSYKGGTGRTMALANAAVLLARDSVEQVLVIDWDLEAPGLHRFFGQPAGAHRLGLIDLVVVLRDRVIASGLNGNDEPATQDLVARVALEDFAAPVVPTQVAGLSAIYAGRVDDSRYAALVNTFDWADLHARAPYIFKALACELSERYGHVLIDSRTGITDASGICTALMPDRLVAVFTPNRQSLLGLMQQVRVATDYRHRSDDLRPLTVFPLASRIELSEEELTRTWRYDGESDDIVGYQPMFEELFRDVYGLGECDLTRYFNEVQIQQMAAYAYGERIAALDREAVSDRLSLAASYGAFVSVLDGEKTPWELGPSKPRREHARGPHWLTRVDELTDHLRRDSSQTGQRSPLTFVLGSGTSDSSRLASKPGVVPYVGYRALACLGRHRQVIVVDLDSNGGVEAACGLLGVPVQSIDPDLHGDALERMRRPLTNLGASPGVTVLRAHGLVDEDRNAPPLPSPQVVSNWRRPLAQCFQHTTIVIQTAVAQEDAQTATLSAILASGGDRPGDAKGSRPRWTFSREARRSEESDGPLSAGLAGRTSPGCFVGGPEVDFDRLLVAILSAELSRPWRKAGLGMSVPDWQHLVYPDPALLRDQLDREVVVLTGRALLGKTTMALILAHWFWLYAEAGFVDDPETETAPIRWIDWRLRDSTAVLIDLDAEGCAAVIIDDPFGTHGLEPRASVAGQIAAARGNGVPVIVTSRPGPPVAELRTRLGLTDDQPQRWYRSRDLLELAEAVRPGASAELEFQVASGRLFSPSYVTRAALGGLRGPDNDPAGVNYPLAVLRSWWDSDDRPLALVAIAVRMQSFDELRGPGRLCEESGVSRNRVLERAFTAQIIAEYWMDQLRWWLPAHNTVVEAIDRFLLEEVQLDGVAISRDALVSTEIVTRGQGLLWLPGALATWRTLSGDAPQTMSNVQALEWGPTLLSGALAAHRGHGWQRARELLDRPHDVWSLSELMTTALNRWGDLGDDESERAHFLEVVLGHRYGAYAVLAASLQIRFLPDEVVEPLLARISRICESRVTKSSIHHLGLLFDCLCSARQPLSDETRFGLLRRLLRTAALVPDLWGAYFAACVYHPAGHAFLLGHDLEDPLARCLVTDSGQVEQLRWLVMWHWVGRARARKLIARHGSGVDGRDQRCERRALARERIATVVAGLMGTERGSATAALLITTLPEGLTEIDAGDMGFDDVQLSARDSAIVAATLSPTHFPPSIQQLVRRYFVDKGNRGLLMDTLTAGLVFDDVRISRPRFVAVDDVPLVYKRAGIDWPRLRALGLGDEQAEQEREQGRMRPGRVGAGLPEVDAARLRPGQRDDWCDTLIAAERVARAGPPPLRLKQSVSWELWEAISERASRGDLRELDAAAHGTRRVEGEVVANTVARLVARAAARRADDARL